MDNMYSAFEKPDVERVLKMNKYMTNVGGHMFKGDSYQHYKWSWSKAEMEELVAQKKATRVRYGNMIKFYSVWLGVEQVYLNDFRERLREMNGRQG